MWVLARRGVGMGARQRREEGEEIKAELFVDSISFYHDYCNLALGVFLSCLALRD
jgi:hypothetical protein